jgi:predicted nucleotidyltransferase
MIKTELIVYKLDIIASEIFHNIHETTEIYLFGSRRHRTRSERSDIDILLKHEGFVAAKDVRRVIDEFPAIDVFLIENVRAVSVINDSYIEAESFDALIKKLSAVKIWNREDGKLDVDIDWEMNVRANHQFTKTVLPNSLFAHEGQFLDKSITNNTKLYLEKITNQINECYSRGLYDACAVLSRRLVEILIIEVYESKQISENIKQDGNYLMLEALIKKINSEKTFDIGRSSRNKLPIIKEIGDRSAHGKIIALVSDLEELKSALSIVVRSLIQISGIQRDT